MTVRMSDRDEAKSFLHYHPNFPNLREAILVVTGENMLPDEWGERKTSFWEKELISMKGSWPVEWGGNMSVLRIVTKLEDI